MVQQTVETVGEIGKKSLDSWNSVSTVLVRMDLAKQNRLDCPNWKVTGDIGTAHGCQRSWMMPACRSSLTFDHLWPSQHFTTMDISASCKTGTACKLQKAAWLHAKFVYMSKVGTNDTWLNELSYLCQQRHALMNHSHGTSSGKFRNNRFFDIFLIDTDGLPSLFQLSGIASLEMPGAPTSDPPKCERINEKL